MPVESKVFTYETEGLSYTVTVYEDPVLGFVANITVNEGAMDVNAVYFGDSEFEGDSASLGGPLNMNGARLGGERVQWDDAVAISDPGLGPDGEDKETYLTSGETLTVGLDIDSLDEIDVFGIRATSTSTPEGSIKGVSDEPEDPEEPEDPLFDKVGFGIEIGANGGIENGVFLTENDLPEGEDPTFENYVNLYVSQFGIGPETGLPPEEPDYSLSQVESVIFYELVPGTDEDGNPIDIPQELFRIDAPEGGFTSAEQLIGLYDDAIANGALDGATTGGDEGLALMAALSLEEEPSEDPSMEDPEEQELFEMI